MSLVHSKRTALPTTSPLLVSGEVGSQIAGAVDITSTIEQPGSSKQHAKVWLVVGFDEPEGFSLYEYPQHMDRIDASSEAELLLRLEQRYPPKFDHTTFVMPGEARTIGHVHNETKKFTPLHKELHQSRRGYSTYWNQTSVTRPSVVVLPYPVYTGHVSDEAELRQLCEAYGPLVLQKAAVSFMPHEAYVVGSGRSVALRYPSSLELVNGTYVLARAASAVDKSCSEYHKAKREWKKRAKPEFERYTFYYAVRLLVPENWPDDHPLVTERLLRGPEMDQRYGWGRRRMIEYGANEFVTLLDINRKLWPKPFWRRDKSGSYYNPIKNVLVMALPNLHAVEQRIRDKKLELFNEAVDWVESRLAYDFDNFMDLDRSAMDNGVTNPEEWFDFDTERKTAFDMRVAMDARDKRDLDDEWQFCRWVRREAKATGISIPKPPVKPITVRQQRQLKKKKLEAARQRRLEKAKLREQTENDHGKSDT